MSYFRYSKAQFHFRRDYLHVFSYPNSVDLQIIMRNFKMYFNVLLLT